MKKLFTLFLAVFLIGTFASTAQELSAVSEKPAQDSPAPKNALYDGNWADPAATSGIVSTHFGGLDPALTITVDNFVVPAGETWTITEFRHRGFVSAVDGAAGPAPEGFSFHIYADGTAGPGDLITEETFMDIDSDPYVSIMPTGGLVLEAGTYWLGFTGYYAASTGTATGRWNVMTWREVTAPLNGSVPYLNDYSDLFGEAANGWQTLPTLGVNVGALDFAIFGTTGGGADTFPVTFNVDMTGAENENEVVFDPAIHDVYVAGTFPQGEWNEPGTNDVFKLAPVGPAKEDVTLYPANWEGSTPVLYTTSEGYVNGTNEYGDIGKGQVFETTEELQITGGYFWFGAAEGTGTVTFTVWDFDGTPGDVIGTVSADVADINVSEDMETAFYIAFDEPITVTSTFLMGIDISGIGSGVVGLMSSTDPEGSDDAWEQWSDGVWYGIHEAASFELSFDMAIFPTVAGGGGGEPDDLFYTLTLDLPADSLSYKYFFVVSGESSWTMGEFPETGDRVVVITGETTFDDVWGVREGTSVEDIVAETGMAVYPNPAVSSVKVSADQIINEIRIFDISGRMVYSSPIGDLNAEINVVNFSRGMYFMQVYTAAGVQTHKVQVMK